MATHYRAISILYWMMTVLLAALMILLSISYLTAAEFKEAFRHLGYPDYFRVELAIAKLLGAVVLVAPVSLRFKEWAYAGFAFTFVSAFIAHLSSEDQAGEYLAPIVALILLGISYISYRLRNRLESENVAFKQ